MFSMEWILRIKVNGEWEECRYATPREALRTVRALTHDYRGQILAASLHAAQQRASESKRREYVN